MDSKKSNLPVIIISIVIVLIIVFLIMNYGKIIKNVYPPNPVIVSSTLNDTSTRLFEYSATVEAVVRNDGGNGDVVLEPTVFQGDRSWTKTIKKYFESKETTTMALKFDEVEMLRGEYRSQVRAYPFGK